ncbi:MAG: peptidoglycan editing factor PgeF [Eubacterium sp.]|nr:peptidoglycan editing factor PgeF [Eubacterium sp.]
MNIYNDIHFKKLISVYNNAEVPAIKSVLLSKYEDRLVHGMSTRLGGVSEAHLASMNLSFSRGDDPEKVMENHRIFSGALGYDMNRTVFSDQVHKTFIRKCTDEDAGKGLIRETDIKETDGLITDCRELPLMTFYADCVPLIFYAPDNNVIAGVHSGWKGTLAGIGAIAADIFEKDYNCDKKKLICFIGPSICKDCYEISRDVAEQFIIKYPEYEKEDIITYTGNDKYHLDLQRACKAVLMDAGLVQENIEISGLCTCCNHEVLFSHRKTNGLRGNLAALIMLK